MHEMQTIVIDDPGRLSVTLYVLSVAWLARLCCPDMVEWIEVLLGMKILERPTNIVLDGCPPTMREANW